MIVNIYQEYQDGQVTDTVVLCNVCYTKWHPAGAIVKLAQAHRNTPCQCCKPGYFGDHLDDMKEELDNDK